MTSGGDSLRRLKPSSLNKSFVNVGMMNFTRVFANCCAKLHSIYCADFLLYMYLHLAVAAMINICL